MKAIGGRFYLTALLACLLVIGCHPDDKDSLGDNYYWIGARISHRNKSGMTLNVIPSKVKRYGADDTYITALQVADSFCLRGSDTRFVDAECTYKSDYPTRRRLMQTGPCYWVIDKKANVVYGPMRRKAYRRLCDSLRIDVPLQYK